MPGIIAAFEHIDSAVEAIEELRQKRYEEITVFTPTPRHEFDHALERPTSKVRLFALLGGLAGVTFGYWIAIWASSYWPLIVGGKPIASWVPYTIFGFEVMVLIGALSTVFALFGLSRVPRLTMTVGYDPRFSGGHFGVWVNTSSEKARDVADILTRHGAVEVRHDA